MSSHCSALTIRQRADAQMSGMSDHPCRLPSDATQSRDGDDGA
jgi:hypothetical protein